MVRGRRASKGHPAHDEWLIDHLTAGPLKPQMARKPGDSFKANAADSRALQDAIRKCWSAGTGGLPGF